MNSSWRFCTASSAWLYEAKSSCPRAGSLRCCSVSHVILAALLNLEKPRIWRLLRFMFKNWYKSNRLSPQRFNKAPHSCPGGIGECVQRVGSKARIKTGYPPFKSRRPNQGEPCYGAPRQQQIGLNPARQPAGYAQGHRNEAAGIQKRVGPPERDAPRQTYLVEPKGRQGQGRDGVHTATQ